MLTPSKAKRNMEKMRYMFLKSDFDAEDLFTNFASLTEGSDFDNYV